ncbi:MAG TPA: C_GCAxxG_C_C family protein [Desulfitobacterium dehalogenans]|uniref:C_GCAxxG_C_C family protein n=1 Tax=Desulfitobacterium dehalogenans TaxID=36854 RepID=A0A7C7D962_9FIRM|nr:C_GCAxxG_C_C family protein [Desulfitobacterium dehalogenans]
MSEERDMSRRKFLKSGILAAGALAVGTSVFHTQAAEAAQLPSGEHCEPPSFPYPYVQLDPEKAKLDGYGGYGKSKCSYGVFEAVIGQLSEKVGYPYTHVPTQVLGWGGTGGGGWGTLCGALIGAATAINYTMEKKEADKVVSELFGWYCDFAFPEFMPAAGKALEYEGPIEKSVAKSPLCHVSVSVWCDASGLKAESKARSERCARITADVAAKTVELLNQFHSNNFKAVYKNEVVDDCMMCHGKGHSLENTRGMMDCAQCHTDVDPDNLVDHIKRSWNILK